MARHFVALLESESLSQEAFFAEAHKALVDLYRVGFALESVDLIHSGPETDFPALDEAALRKQNKQLISKLGGGTLYWEVFDPVYEKHAEPSQGWLVDDFADIHGDLKLALHKIDVIGTDEAIEDALWQIRFGFYHHWGHHCINAMRALHYLWYEGKVAM